MATNTTASSWIPLPHGRGPKGEIWKIEDNIWDFVGLTAQLLSDDALFFLINSYTTGLQPAVLSYMMNSTLTKKFGGHVEAEGDRPPCHREWAGTALRRFRALAA